MRMTMFAFVALASVAITLTSCGGGEKKEDATENQPAEIAINTTHKYVCPMNCEGSASNEPGKCVVCGMDLVENPNYAGGEPVTAPTDSAPSADSAAISPETTLDKDNHEGHNH